MEIKVNAVVLKAVDYKDNDKILTLYSLERGRLTTGIKGVKKATAKLKFATEPFCFAEYILASKNDRYTVINASYIDSFYNLRTDIKKYYVSSVLLESMLFFTENELEDARLFNNFITAVKNVCYLKNEKLSLLKFLINSLNILGYGIYNTDCEFCEKDIKNRVFFSVNNGSFCCENCYRKGFIEIKKTTFETYKIIEKAQFENLQNLEIPLENVNNLLKFVFYIYKEKLDISLKSSNLLFTI